MVCPSAVPSPRVTTRRGVYAAGLLTAMLFWWGTGQPALAERTIDYLSVEANEGDSSGGHAALRFGNETFHFQHESPGILRIRRHETSAFRHAYTMLGNRSIRESRIAVSDDTYTLLRNGFVRLLLVQDAQLEIRDALRRDVVLFERLLAQHRAPQATADGMLLELAGLGYFLPDAPSHPGSTTGTVTGEASPPSPALLSLRNRIRAVYGENFVTDKIARTRGTLRSLELRAARPRVSHLSRHTLPTFESPPSTRFEDTLRALFALELLQASPGLRPGTFWTPEDTIFRLEPSEALTLKGFAAQLETDLVRLVDSPRADWGPPFVLGMARLAAIEATLASGRLVLLDIFPPGSQVQPRRDSTLRPYLPMMEKEMREVFLRKRQEFFTGSGFREADYAALERSGNLVLDISRAMTTGSALREPPESPFPSRPALLSVPLPQLPDEAALMGELAAARNAEQEYSSALDHLYSYDLFRRNCVTEIFAVINETLARHAPDREKASDPVAPVRAESDRRLGGYVDAADGLAFIPFVSAGKVEHSYAVVASRDLPSYRTTRLEEMYRQEPPLAVFLRESNTLTSTVYRPGPDDSYFLFFTDDAPALRPLFGAFNLLAGLGESLAGLLTMPVSGPERLVAGARGVLFSLPELVFVNLRKGSTAYVEQAAVHSGQDRNDMRLPGAAEVVSR